MTWHRLYSILYTHPFLPLVASPSLVMLLCSSSCLSSFLIASFILILPYLTSLFLPPSLLPFFCLFLTEFPHCLPLLCPLTLNFPVTLLLLSRPYYNPYSGYGRPSYPPYGPPPPPPPPPMYGPPHHRGGYRPRSPYGGRQYGYGPPPPQYPRGGYYGRY